MAAELDRAALDTERRGVGTRVVRRPVPARPVRGGEPAKGDRGLCQHGKGKGKEALPHMAGEVPRSSKAIAETVKMAEEPQRADGGRGGSSKGRAHWLGDARKTSAV